MDTITAGDLEGRGPKYAALAGLIRERIAAGDMPPETRLPPVRDLAWRLKITPGTVSRAYSLLTDEGRLTARVGRGTFVAGRDAGISGYAVFPPGDEGYNLKSSVIPDVGQSADIAEAMRQTAANLGANACEYPSRAHDLPVIDALLSYLAPIDLGPVSQGDVILTSGGQHALMTVLQLMIRGPRRTVLVEDLSYPGFRFAASLAHARTASVRTDGEGITPESLDAACRQHGPAVLFTLPDHANPTLIHTPPHRREAIAEVARRHDLHVVQDDTFYLGAPLGPSYRALLPTQGWHIASLAKCLSPTLRFGALIAPEGQGAAGVALAQQQAYGISGLVLGTVRHLLETGAARRIRTDIAKALARRTAIAREVLSDVDLTSDPAMPFVFLTLPPHWRASSFTAHAASEGLTMRAAEEYALPGEPAPGALRLYLNGRITEEALRSALTRVADLAGRPRVELAP